LSHKYMLQGIDYKLWIEFKAACAHFDLSIRATFLEHIKNIVNDYRVYKMNYGEPQTKRNRNGKR